MRSRLRNLAIGLALGLAGVLVGAQSITIPNTFVNGTTADATQVNANFTALSANALNRAAGIFSGTATPASDNTIDLGSGALRFANVYGTQFRGGGANLTALAAANITAGGVLPALDGSALTNLNASSLASGTVPSARLGGWTVITTTSTGTQNDFAPGLAGHTIIRCNNAALLTITGLTGGVDGQVVVIESIGAGEVDLSNQAAGSGATARFINFATSAVTRLAAGVGTAEFVYDGTTTRWRLVAHEQGAWITPTYAGGTFTGSGALTWTVDAGDVSTDAYWLKGRALMVSFALDATSTGGVASTQLTISNVGFGGYTLTKTQYAVAQILDAGTEKTGLLTTLASSMIVVPIPSGNWSNAAANNTYIRVGITVEVN